MRETGRKFFGPLQPFMPGIHTDPFAFRRADGNPGPPEIGVQYVDARRGGLLFIRRDGGQDIDFAGVGQRMQYGHGAHVVVVGSHIRVENQRNGLLFRRAGRAAQCQQ